MRKISMGMLACMVMLLAACDDIFERDISDKEVVLVAPGDEVEILQNKVTFLWEPVAGANWYLLQVVSPSFDAPETVTLDTLIAGTRFAYNFLPGTYAWRVSAENSAYYTPYSARTFTVDSLAGNPAAQRVKLVSPKNAFVTRESTLKFVWRQVETATSYQLQISGATELLLTTRDTTASLGFIAFDDTLRWQVVASLPDQTIKYQSEQRWFLIDRTAPAGSALLTPQAWAVFTPQDDLTFSWEANTTADFDRYRFTLYEKRDGAFVRLEQKELKEVTLQRLASLGSLAVGEYLWEIQTIDKLGNISTVGTFSRGFEVR